MGNNSSEIRAWAVDQGLDVKERGNLPGAVVAAYQAAHDEGPEPQPDFGAAGAESAIPDEVSAPAGREAGNAARPDSPPAGPPPPADLDEARAQRGGGGRTRPGWAGTARPGRARGKPAAAAAAPTRAQLGDIEGKLALLLSVPVTVAAMADPVCGGAAADNLDLIVAKAVPLIAHSPAAVRWFTKDGTVLLWLDLIIALREVGMAVWAHHVAGTVMVIDGRPVASRRLPDGRVVPLDQAPPAPEGPPLDAYTTQGHVPPVPRTA